MDDFLKKPEVLGTMLVLVGLLPLIGGAFSWEWMWSSPRLRRYEERFGRGPTRGFLVIVGLALIVAGVAIATGLLKQGAFAR
jgi:uncharacterized membrane protein YidH (DUF202 family)